MASTGTPSRTCSTTPLLDYTSPGARKALEELGVEARRPALDYLADEALVRPVGPASYQELRARLLGAAGVPAPAPERPAPAADVLAEVRERIVPHLYNAFHPRSFSYFTPPPLVMSIVGELLAQWFHQGIDVYHSGPVGALVEEEVTQWLVELVGAGAVGWGVLTSGRVMANCMAMTVARERHLRRLLADAVRRSPDFEGVVERPELSVVCFRHLVEGMSPEELDAHQDRLQRALEVSGEAWVSTTRLRGRTYLRAGMMNWLTTADDARALLDILRRLAMSAAPATER